MLSILLSQAAAERFGPRIAQIMGARAYRLVHLDAPPGADGDFGIDAAFLSRDITGRSGKFAISETMQRFFDILERSRGLRWVQTHSAGTDRPVWRSVKARGIAMTTGAGSMSGTVALSAVGGVIALARRFPDLMDAQRRHAWEPMLEDRAPHDLAGQHALVIGLGPIGAEIARLLKALGLRVTGARREARAQEHCDAVVGYGEIATHLPTTDWLVLVCPLTELTRGLVDARALALLPRGAHVVNVARGEVVVEKELIEALRSGHLGGAWLDVFEHEPLDPTSPLWDLPRVMISPHSSAHSKGNYDRAGEIFLDNLGRFVEGKPLRNAVKPG